MLDIWSSLEKNVLFTAVHILQCEQDISYTGLRSIKNAV